MSKPHDRQAATNKDAPYGASAGAIQFHYDVGNDFFRLWLDSSMTYSAALWADNDETLESAQENKRAYHIQMSRSKDARKVLDIGCGWGSCLVDLATKFNVPMSVGLTLSEAQKNWIEQMNMPTVDVRLEGWQNHETKSPYDAIISIGALEHFVQPNYNNKTRQKVYKDFFKKCHRLLKPGGWLSLQTQAYLLGHYTASSPLSAIFPESDMPRLHEILQACDRLFEPGVIVNSPKDYVKTLEHWIRRFEENRVKIMRCTSGDVYERYLRFLKGGLRGYSSDRFMLIRMSLRRVGGG